MRRAGDPLRRICGAVLAAALWLAAAVGPAAADLDVEASGVLENVRVSKPGLAFGASAELRFDLEYLVRVSALMGAPVVNCGLRVRNLTGTARMVLDGQRRTVPITGENADEVAILHLGFILHNYSVLLDDAFFTSLAFRCQPGVIAREGSEPFNVASNPGLGNLFCAGVRLEGAGEGVALPDMLGPDWCAGLGGSPVPADTARALIADGVLDSLGQPFGFQPAVVALGIGIAELVGSERDRMAAADGTADAERPPHDPASVIARLAAERRAAADPERAEPDAEAPRAETADAAATLAAVRAEADATLTRALAACRADPPRPVRREDPAAVAAARESHLAACEAAAPPVLNEVTLVCQMSGMLYGVAPCTQTDYDERDRVREVRRARAIWEQTNTCAADADAAAEALRMRLLAEADAENDRASRAWAAAAEACAAEANAAHQAAIAAAEDRARRLSVLERLRDR